MLNSTLFLIELLVSGLSDYNVLKFVIETIDNIEPQGIYIILSLMNNPTEFRVINTLIKKIKTLPLSDLSLILHCFPDEKNRYYIFVRCIKLCTINTTDDEIVKHFTNPKIISKIKHILRSIKKLVSLNDIVWNLGASQKEDRLNLLETSIKNNNIRLSQAEQYCEVLKDIFDEQYNESCEILGINPEIYTQI